MEFRLLRADEIDCRISTIKENGLSLLLYKDARCDMSILDETVGAFNWQRHHSRDNANCVVSIWDEEKEQWIEKEDTGTESFTEKEKGLASDSFKRACFNWGLGRELYTAPFMWVSKEKCKIMPKGQGFTCYDRFVVQDIKYVDRRITYVRVYNCSTKQTIEYGNPVADVGNEIISETKAKALQKMLEDAGSDVAKLLMYYKVPSVAELNERQYAAIVAAINNKKK